MRAVALSVVLLACSALAQEVAATPREGQAWSVVGGRTIGAGHNQLNLGVGWPGVGATYYRGVASNIDVGLAGHFIYGVEGLVTQVYPGLKVQGLLRFKLLDTGKVSLAATFEPGPFFVTDRQGFVTAAFSVPVGLRLGVAAASSLTLGVTFDLPLWVQFGAGGGLNVPILTGVGVEYFIKSDLCLFFKTRMGPTIRPYRLAEFTFDASIGVGLKL